MADTKVLDTGLTGSTILGRTEVQTFLAGATIVAKDWVQFDDTKTGVDRVLYVKQAGSVATTGNAAVVGIALEAGVTGKPVRVVVAGYVEGANVASAVIAGQPIAVIGTAGRGSLSDAVATTACGVALENASSNTCDIVVTRKF